PTHAVAVAKTIELLGVDSVDVKAALKQGLDHSAAWNLDGDGNLSGIIGQSAQPLCKLHNRVAGVREGSLGHNSSFVVEHAGLVGFTRPIDTNIDPIIAFHHTTSLFSSAADDASSNPVLALAARLPTGRASTVSLAGARVLLRRSKRKGDTWHSQQGGRIHILHLP